MRRSTFVVLLVMLMLLPTRESNASYGGKGAIWHGERVPVVVSFPAQYHDDVLRLWSAMNQALPPSAPTFDVQFTGRDFCPSEIHKKDYREVIVFCATESPFGGDSTFSITKRHVLSFAASKISVSFPRPYVLNTMCHEAMHAVSTVNDWYDRLPETSCVQGSNLIEPGSWDRKFLKKTYQRWTRKVNKR